MSFVLPVENHREMKPNIPTPASVTDDDNGTEQSKPRRKRKRRSAADGTDTASLATTAATTRTPAPAPVKSTATLAGDSETEDGEGEKKQRFIVFVGNLPYRCRKEAIAKLFQVDVAAVRMPTDKSNNKPKGIAFVDFPDSFALRKSLKLHHAEFEGRKINVELTAGGGGNSVQRMKKIEKKNENLKNERKKMAEKRSQDKTSKASTATQDGKAVEGNGERVKLSDNGAGDGGDEPAKKKRKRKPKKKNSSANGGEGENSGEDSS